MISSITANFNTVINRVAYLRKNADSPRKKQLDELRHSIEHTKAELNCAIENFNNVTEPKLIDFYIYKIQSEQTHYDQLICEYKILEGP